MGIFRAILIYVALNSLIAGRLADEIEANLKIFTVYQINVLLHLVLLGLLGNKIIMIMVWYYFKYQVLYSL